MRIQIHPWLVARAANHGGRFPLRRLTTIQDGRSWRRDVLAGPATTDDPISRRSVVVSGRVTAPSFKALKGRRPGYYGAAKECGLSGI